MSIAAHRHRKPARSVRCYAAMLVVCLAAVYGLAFAAYLIWPGALG